MSMWLKSAMIKAADSVVQHAGQAVAEGAKILQDRIAARNFRNVKQTVKELEEAAIYYRGPERILLLRRWLVELTEIEKLCDALAEDKVKTLEHHLAVDEAKESLRKPSMVLYYDTDVGGEALNFRDVFLKSQALEGITLSMILEVPNEEEVSLLLEIFRLCLTGGKDVHNAIVSSIQDLATVFSNYQEEVLAKQEELLQFAQSAITGLKINSDLARIDAESSSLRRKLMEMPTSQMPLNEGDKAAEETIIALKVALVHIRICSRLEELLLKKKDLNIGDSPKIHAQKVDKLKVLLESLANSSAKAEKHISDSRLQKEEALKVRVTKTSEASKKEKEMAAEILKLQRKKDDLEAELNKVNTSLAAAQARLLNSREERDQFEEANNLIIEHLKTREDELSKSITSCRVEADVLKMWINFLEDTWVLQRSNAEIIEKHVNDELERHGDYFVNLTIQLLTAFKKDLEPWITRIGTYVDNLKILSQSRSGMSSRADNEEAKEFSPRRSLEEEYLAYETKIITTFSVVDTMKRQFYAQQGKISRHEQSVKELFDAIEKLRTQFDSIERPHLDIESRPGAEAQVATNVKQQDSTSAPAQGTEVSKTEKDEQPKSPAIIAGQVLEHESELSKLESEFGKLGQHHSTEEIGDWEFDELERELAYATSATRS
ncbi:synaptonemal complex protein 1-like isoform X4 [Senna tora]|uniref:Synaptonemal complex protein 1-like isoform X4 n=1 Tax=Senna tora TaxID=362788 RepID=A0A834TJN6_9FABA|nr:synaptonemal complex protein 1-like isoform X4 [Senna tora]